MKVYLAAPFSMKEEIARRAAELESHGIHCTSRWVKESASPNSTLSDVSNAYLQDHAQIDLDDINEADVFVVVTVNPLTPIVRGGRHFESGYAYAQKKTFMIVGPHENIFHYLPDVYQRDNWTEALKTLVTWKGEYESENYTPYPVG